MIRFVSLSLRNFLSYGNNTTIINLERPGTTLILGEDLDNTSEGRSANGVGKTVVLNALVYALFDRAVSDISKDNLINNVNKKHMEVSVDFEKDGIFYRIVRARKMKSGAAGNYVMVFRNKKSSTFNVLPISDDNTTNDDITPDSVSNANILIEQILGFPYDLFSRVVVFGASQIPFLDLPFSHTSLTNQRGIVEHLFGLTVLTDKANILKERIKDTNHQIGGIQIQIEQLKREYERHEKQVVSMERRIVNWDEQQYDDIGQLRAKLKKISGIDFDAERLNHDKLSEVDIELCALLEKQRDIELDIKTTSKKSSIANKKLVHLRDDRCPECLQEFKDTKKKIREYEKIVQFGDDKIPTLSDHLNLIDINIETVTKKHKKIKGMIGVTNLDELLEIKNQTESIKSNIDRLVGAENPFSGPLEELKTIDMDDIDYDKINMLTKKLEHQKFLLKLLTKKDSFVRKVLLNKYLPFLNNRLQQYLTSLGLRHIVQFTADLKTVITQFGRELDFGNLSAGQRARVNLALSFAFRDVLQSLHTPVNICMIDEVLDIGLDAVGVQMAAKLLKRKARDENISMYIISHRDELGAAFDNALTIQMEKGFSYIKKS